MRKSKKPGASANPPVKEQRGLRFDENDLLGQLTAHEGSVLWLGRCTASEIEHTLETAGLIEALHEKGLSGIIFKIEPFEEFGQTLKIYSGAAEMKNLIAEARFQERVFTPSRRMPETFSQFSPVMLSIDWLLMQNPFATFSAERPRLPGQTHPGLGLARRVMEQLKQLCAKLGRAGLLNYPEYFHNAYLYREHFHFYDPVREGIVAALHRDLSVLLLADLSWAIEEGCVHDVRTGKIFEWHADVQILPMQAAVRDYFVSSWYRQRVEETIATQSFALDQEGFEEFRRKSTVDKG